MNPSKTSLWLIGLFLVIYGCSPLQNTFINFGENRYSKTTDKVLITAEKKGIYKIDLNKLGWSNANVDSITLTKRGNPIPLFLDDESLYFYNGESDSIFSVSNYYFLSKENAAHPSSIITVTNPVSSTSESSTSASPDVFHKIHIEKNQIYLPQKTSPDHWLMDRFVAPDSKEYQFTAENVSNGSGTITLSFWGTTASPSQEKNHHIEVLVNEEKIGDYYWSGISDGIVTFQIQPGIIIETKNKIEIKSPGDTGAAIDVIYLNWIDINFLQTFTLGGTQQEFSLPQNELCFTLNKNQADFYLFEVSDYASSLNSAWFIPENHNVACVSQTENQTYIAFPKGDAYTPETITNYKPQLELKNNKNKYDYIIISPDDFFKELEPLITHRKNDGLSPLLVSANDIYNQFNDGYPEPVAINKFIKYAHDYWEIPPKYILLIGDATYDPKGYLSSPSPTQIPSPFVETAFGGETSSDVPLADINNDFIPDISIGRIPANNKAELNSALNKIFAYEKAISTTNYKYDVLAISDPQDAAFTNDAKNFLSHLPSTTRKYSIFESQGGQPVAETIKTIFSEGVLFTAYFGHGSIDMWGKDNLLDIKTVDTFNNANNPTIVLAFTCLSGFFTHPQVQSLSEKMLFAPRGGAAAVIAPSSLTLPADQSFLSSALVDYYVHASEPRLGDLLLYAWSQVPTNNDTSIDVVKTFMLFGDPALKVKPNTH